MNTWLFLNYNMSFRVLIRIASASASASASARKEIGSCHARTETPLAPPRDIETVSTKQVLGETVLDPVESKEAEQINRRYAIKRGQIRRVERRGKRWLGREASWFWIRRPIRAAAKGTLEGRDGRSGNRGKGSRRPRGGQDPPSPRAPGLHRFHQIRLPLPATG